MNIQFSISPEFANTIASSIQDRSRISSVIWNARQTYNYVKSFSIIDSDIKEYLFSKLTEELNNLKSIEFEVNNYNKKEDFYKIKHKIETKLNKI